MALIIELSYNNGAETLQLPVNPEKINVSVGQNYEDVDVNKLGEFTIIKNEKLDTVSISSFFPRDYNAAYCEYEDVPLPWAAVNKIRKWISSGNPIRLKVGKRVGVNQYSYSINMAVTVRDFNFYEKAGCPDDLYYDISFKEFKFITVRKVSTTSSGTTVSGGTKRPNAKVTSKTYTVKTGDSLWTIAQKQLNSGSRWKEIYNLNKAKIGNNSSVLKAGITLVLP